MFRFIDGLQPECKLVSVPEEQRKRITEEELVRYGMQEVLERVGGLVREKYTDVALRSLSPDSHVSDNIVRDFIAGVISETRKRAADEKGPQMQYETIVPFLLPYSCGEVREYSLFDNTEMHLYAFHVGVVCDHMYVKYDRFVKDFRGVDIPLLKAILLTDASMSAIWQKASPIILEVESIFKSQQIYQTFATNVIEPLVSEYEGEYKITYKGNRCTVNFYLDGNEKAFVTFFRDEMPWKLPQPPKDPESLRAVCNAPDSPFIITSLSKRDRRTLNNK